MSQTVCSFIGAGSIHIQPYDQSASGNVSEFTFSFEQLRYQNQEAVRE